MIFYADYMTDATRPAINNNARQDSKTKTTQDSEYDQTHLKRAY